MKVAVEFYCQGEEKMKDMFEIPENCKVSELKVIFEKYIKKDDGDVFVNFHFIGFTSELKDDDLVLGGEVDSSISLTVKYNVRPIMKRTDTNTGEKKPQDFPILMQKLVELGFNDQELNEKALTNNFFNISAAVESLISGNIPDQPRPIIFNDESSKKKSKLDTIVEQYKADPTKALMIERIKGIVAENNKEVSELEIIQLLESSNWDEITATALSTMG